MRMTTAKDKKNPSTRDFLQGDVNLHNSSILSRSQPRERDLTYP